MSTCWGLRFFIIKYLNKKIYIRKQYQKVQPELPEADRFRFDQISNISVKHSDTANFGIIGDPWYTNTVIRLSCHFSGTAGAMAIDFFSIVLKKIYFDDLK